MKTRIKNLFIKKEKTTKWDWFFRIGVMLLGVAVIFTISAITLDMATTNNKEMILFGVNALTVIIMLGLVACTSAITGMFFLFCGKVKDK